MRLVRSSEDGPLANTAHRGTIKELAAVAEIRSRLRFRDGDIPGAIDDAVSISRELRSKPKTARLFPSAQAADRIVASRRLPQHNFDMRFLAAMLVFVGVALGIYEYALKRMPTSDPGTAPTQAISLTGVRGDLLQIAQAERSFAALNDYCASLDELISSHSLTMERPERDGYTYTIQCFGGDFTAMARHAPAPEGSPIRYPTLAIDQTMQVRDLQ